MENILLLINKIYIIYLEVKLVINYLSITVYILLKHMSHGNSIIIFYGTKLEFWCNIKSPGTMSHGLQLGSISLSKTSHYLFIF